MNTRKTIILVLATAVFILGSYLFNNHNPFIAQAEPEQITIPVESAPIASYAMKSSDEQIVFWQQKAQRDDRDYISLTYLGQAYLQRGRETGDAAAYGRAQAALEQALTINPNYELTLAYLSATLISQHDFQGLCKPLSASTTLTPAHCKPWPLWAMPVWSWDFMMRQKLLTNH